MQSWTVRHAGLLTTLAASALLFACATSPKTYIEGDESEVTKEPTEPPASQPLPPSNSSSGSSGASSSGSSGASSGGSSGDGGTSSGSSGTSSGSSGTSSGSSGTSSGSSGSSSGSSSGGTCATTAPSNACGLDPQCGCTATQTCDITNKTTGAVSCVPAGAGAAKSQCTSSSQCAKGLTCAYGTCRPYCNAGAAACAAMGPCEDLYVAGAAVPNGKVCSQPCDPKNPAAACGTNTCVWDSSLKMSDCDTAGTKNELDACTGYNDCRPGMACISFFGSYECEKFCRIGVAGDCSGFLSCTDVYGANAPTSGGAKLGHCQ